VTIGLHFLVAQLATKEILQFIVRVSNKWRHVCDVWWSWRKVDQFWSTDTPTSHRHTTKKNTHI